MAMAARVTGQLSEQKDVVVDTLKGRLGEFRVSINGKDVIETSRLWYPNPNKVVTRIKELLQLQAT